MDLTEKEKAEYIQNIVIPFHQGMLTKFGASAIYDAHGRILLATDRFANYFEIPNDKMIGKNHSDLIAGRHGTEEISPGSYNMLKILNRIQQKIIREGCVLHYIIFASLRHGFDSHEAFHFPIFYPNGEVAASRSVIKKFSFFSAVNYFNQIITRGENLAIFSTTNTNTKNIKLTQRQHEVLFLLIPGFSQEEAAQFLNISRGALSTVISRQLCPKFGIDGE